MENSQQPVRKQNFGLAALIGGILQIILGFSFSLLPVAIFLITIVAGLYGFKTRNEKQKKMAIIGIVLCLIMVVLFLLFRFTGIVGSIVAQYTE